MPDSRTEQIPTKTPVASPPDKLRSGGEAHLQAMLSKDGKTRPWIENMTGSWFYFNKGTLRDLGLSSSIAEKALAEWLTSRASRRPISVPKLRANRN